MTTVGGQVDVWVCPSGTVGVVAPQGDLDLTRAGDLRSAVMRLLDDVRPLIVLDLKRVPFIDSTGIGVIAAAAARARSNGQHVGVVEADGRTRKVLELTGLGPLCLPPLPVQPTGESA